MKPAMTKQQATFTDAEASAIQLYRELAVGKEGFSFLAWYELCTILAGGLPGIVGLGLRSFLYPTLFMFTGKRPAIGRGVLVRNPKSISLGKRVVVDDYAALDVRGHNASLSLGDHVCVGRFSILAAKGGTISLAHGVNIGSNCRIATQSKISIGESTLVAAYSYIGPGNHQRGDEETPLIARDMEIKGGVTIGKNVWIGTRATILDGVTIGDGAIVGAHSLVKEDVPAGAVVVGTPARVVKE